MTIKTLIILDWDDTLFPTSWVVNNNIELTNLDNNNYVQYMMLFSELDIVLYKLFSKLSGYGKVVIVTNAIKKWVLITSNVLPHTQKFINNHVDIFSARELYQDKYPSNLTLWKKLFFKKIVADYFPKNCIQNIISVGDAEHEFVALTDLYDKNDDKLLKSVRFMSNPNFEGLLDQLDVLIGCIDKITTCKYHMDLKFQEKVHSTNV